MAVDLNSFIRFASTTSNTKATIGLSASAAAPADDFKLKSTSALGRFFASIRNAFSGPSASESRAVQAFIQAVKQEYGSEGAQILARFQVSDSKPLKTFQVQQIASTLTSSRTDGNLTDFHAFSAIDRTMAEQANNRSNAYHHENETPLYRAVNAAISYAAKDAQMLIDHTAGIRQPNAAQQLAKDVAHAVLSSSALSLFEIPAFNAQYQKRLELDSNNLEAPYAVKQMLQSDAEVHAAGVVHRLLQDIFAQAQPPARV